MTLQELKKKTSILLQLKQHIEHNLKPYSLTVVCYIQ